MPGFKGSRNEWNLGNSNFAMRIHKYTVRDPPTNTPSIDDWKIAPDVSPEHPANTPDNSQCITCSQCCDYSQTNLHTAKAIVLNCMDFRLRDNVTCHLNLKGYKNNYDEVISAGSSLGYNSFSTYTDWDIFIDDTILLAYNLHEISEILIVEHEKCGAYKAKYGDMTSDQEYQYHIDNSKTCVDVLWSKFNDTDGSVNKIHNLKIIAYIISIDGCSFTELYRRE